MSKTVSIGTKPTSQKSDAWVQAGEQSKKETKTTKNRRITFDVPADLHKAIKIHCTLHEKNMADEIVRILRDNFNLQNVLENA